MLIQVVHSHPLAIWLPRIVMQHPGRKVLLRALKPMCGPTWPWVANLAEGPLVSART
jgi:hypothetical protein